MHEKTKRGDDEHEPNAVKSSGAPSLEQRVSKVCKALDAFEAPPFTIQRLSEIVLGIRCHSSLSKWLFSLEKMVFLFFIFFALYFVRRFPPFLLTFLFPPKVYVTSTQDVLSESAYAKRIKELAAPLPPPSDAHVSSTAELPADSAIAMAVDSGQELAPIVAAQWPSQNAEPMQS